MDLFKEGTRKQELGKSLRQSQSISVSMVVSFWESLVTGSGTQMVLVDISMPKI